MLIYSILKQCIGQELDQFENVVFATSASSKIKNSKQKLTLIVRSYVPEVWTAHDQFLFLQIHDPEENPIFEEKISIGAKRKELEYKIDKRGVYKLCYELGEGEDAQLHSLSDIFDVSTVVP